MIGEAQKRCLLEALDTIRRVMPAGTDLDEWFNMAPGFPVNAPELGYYIGYLQGAADAEGVTVCELLDGAGIDPEEAG